MKSTSVSITAIFFLLSLKAIASVSTNLRILTSDIPPLSVVENNNVTGYCVEIVKEIQRRINDKTEIEVLPWPRAYRMGQTLPNIILICPKRTQEREKIFKWVGPMFESSTVFYKRRDANISIHTLDEAKKISGIMVPRNFYSTADLLNKGFKNLQEVNSTTLAMTMLLKGREPLLVMEEKQAIAILKEMNQDPNIIQIAFRFAPSISYLAFSKEISNEQVQKWQHIFNQMKKDGTVAKLSAKWL